MKPTIRHLVIENKKIAIPEITTATNKAANKDIIVVANSHLDQTVNFANVPDTPSAPFKIISAKTNNNI